MSLRGAGNGTEQVAETTDMHFLTIRDWKSEIKVLAGLVSGETSSRISDGRLLRVLLWPFLCDVQEGGEKLLISGLSSYKDASPD